MKCLLVFAVVVAVAAGQFVRPQAHQQYRPAPAFKAAASAAPRSSGDQDATITRYDNDVGPDGSYSYSVETSNGISQQEQGAPRNIGNESPVASQGSFSYPAPDGTPISLSYVADENGFQPSGAHLPVAPEIPPQIARALEYIRRNPPPQKK